MRNRDWIATGIARCSMCKVEKPSDQFYVRPDRASIDHRCKSCMAARHKDWRERKKAAYAELQLPAGFTQVCWRCKVQKPADAFGVSRSLPNGLNPSCRECARSAVVPHNRKRRLTDPKGRKASIWTRYRLRPEQYEQMRASQGNACAICRDEFTKETPRVDHCHTTGQVRGLLCQRCNALLAAFDLEGFMEKALAYLARTRVA